MVQNISHVFNLYRKDFISTYAIYVSLDKIKPKQILFEESNALAHLSQYFNEELTDEIRNDNLKKAKNHLTRATLDLNKLLWAALADKLDFIKKHPNKLLTFNLPTVDVLNRHNIFTAKGTVARRYEMTNIGNNIDTVINNYKEINKIGMDLLEKVDIHKIETINKLTYIIKTKEFIYGAIIGITASLIAAFIFDYIKSLP